MDLLVNYGIKASVVPPAAGYMELLHDTGTLTSAVTSYTIPNLSISKKDNILLVSNVISPSTNLSLYINNNQTASNYYRQLLQAFATTVGGNRVNNAEYMTGVGADVSFCKIKISENGYFSFQTESTRTYNGGSGLILEQRFGTSDFTVSSINRLDIVSNSSIQPGSRFQLYKVRD